MDSKRQRKERQAHAYILHIQYLYIHKVIYDIWVYADRELCYRALVQPGMAKSNQQEETKRPMGYYDL